RRHPPPHRAGRNRRHRSPRHPAPRGTHPARKPAHQNRAHDGAVDRPQDAGRLRLLVPALARSRPHPALAELKFIDRAEVVHLLRPPGTGKSHLATALAVEAVKAGRSVAFSTLADIITSLAKAEKEGSLRERIRYLCRASLLIVD